MKKLAFLIVVLAVTYSGAAEDRRNELSANLGIGIPLTDIDMTDNDGFGKQRIGTPGFSGGAQYLFSIVPQLGLGGEFNYTSLGESESDVLLPFNARTKLSADTALYLGVVKFRILTEGSVRPYIIGGAGMHNTHLKASVQAPAGTVLGDRSETLIDDTQSEFAFAIGGGVDVPINEVVFLGLETRYQHLGEGHYKLVFGDQDLDTTVDGTGSMVNVFARLGVRF